MNHDTMKGLTVNGKPGQFSAASLADLLEELELGGAAVVAERNGEIVKQDDFAATLLSDGDKIELIRFVGGG